MKFARVKTKEILLQSMAVALFFALGCAKDKGSDSNNASTITELEGTWKTACIVNGAGSSQETILVSGNNLTETTYIYSDNTDCSTSDSNMVFGYQFSIGNSLTTPDGAKEVNRSITSYDMTPTSIARATALNTDAFCGLTSWANGITQHLIGLSCGGYTLNSGAVDYNIYQVSGGTLVFGDESGANNGGASATRPTTLSTKTYAKQ